VAPNEKPEETNSTLSIMPLPEASCRATQASGHRQGSVARTNIPVEKTPSLAWFDSAARGGHRQKRLTTPEPVT